MTRGALKDIIIGFAVMFTLLLAHSAINLSSIDSGQKVIFNVILGATSVCVLFAVMFASSIRQRMYDAELKLQQELKE
jgi:hypothetical protein